MYIPPNLGEADPLVERIDDLLHLMSRNTGKADGYLFPFAHTVSVQVSFIVL